MKRKIIAFAILLLAILGFMKTFASVPEDLNGDGVVDLDDLREAAKAYGSYPEHKRWNEKADLNGDGIVNLKDLYLIAKAFSK